MLLIAIRQNGNLFLNLYFKKKKVIYYLRSLSLCYGCLPCFIKQQYNCSRKKKWKIKTFFICFFSKGNFFIEFNSTKVFSVCFYCLFYYFIFCCCCCYVYLSTKKTQKKKNKYYKHLVKWYLLRLSVFIISDIFFYGS